MPFAFDRDWARSLPYLAELSPLIAFAGFTWIAAEDQLGSSVKHQGTRDLIQRMCAGALLAFAGTLVVSIAK